MDQRIGASTNGKRAAYNYDMITTSMNTIAFATLSGNSCYTDDGSRLINQSLTSFGI